LRFRIEERLRDARLVMAGLVPASTICRAAAKEGVMPATSAGMTEEKKRARQKRKICQCVCLRTKKPRTLAEAFVDELSYQR
jgi:hypothetical protein